jgi:hypothetical protein
LEISSLQSTAGVAVALLGDIYLSKFSPKANVRLVFRQGSVNSSYLLHLYNLFQEFVTTPPSVSEVVDKKNRNI